MIAAIDLFTLGFEIERVIENFFVLLLGVEQKVFGIFLRIYR